MTDDSALRVCVCVRACVRACVCVCVSTPVPKEFDHTKELFNQLYSFPAGVQAIVSGPSTNENGRTAGEARRDAFLCTCGNF